MHVCVSESVTKKKKMVGKQVGISEKKINMYNLFVFA